MISDTIQQNGGSSHRNGGPPEGGSLEELRRTVIRLVEGLAHSPTRLRVAEGGTSLEVEWAPGGVAGATAPAVSSVDDGVSASPSVATDSQCWVAAPSVGTFYRSPEPGRPPFVEVGDTVTAGQQIAIVEVMKLMVPVKSEGAGVVVAVAVDDAQPVEFGERLFHIEQPGDR